MQSCRDKSARAARRQKLTNDRLREKGGGKREENLRGNGIIGGGGGGGGEGRDRQTHREREREADRQTDRQKDRGRDRLTVFVDGACWVFLLPAFTHPGSFEFVRWNECVHRLDFGLHSHPKEFSGDRGGGGEGVDSEPMLAPWGKSFY